MGIKSKLLVVSTLVLSTSANAALISRLGGDAFYDTDSNLTWLADGNYAMNHGYGPADVFGRMNWDVANTWATTLNVGGVTGWRLPTTIDVGNDGVTYPDFNQGIDAGYNITTHSELSNMFYNVLGNTAAVDIFGTDTVCGGTFDCLTNQTPFFSVESAAYWSGTEYAPNAANGWYFDTSDGSQDNLAKGFSFNAWAVQTGDIAAVPVPAAVWLFGSGLLGLIGVARRKR